MSKPMIELFRGIEDVIATSDLEEGQIFSVLMKLAALGAIYCDMNHAEFLRAADMVYRIESFVMSDIKDLPVQ